MVTNSVVPIAKPPMASASTASRKWRAVVAVGGAVAVSVIVTHAPTPGPRTPIPRARSHRHIPPQTRRSSVREALVWHEQSTRGPARARLRNVYAKLGITSRAELAARGYGRPLRWGAPAARADPAGDAAR